MTNSIKISNQCCKEILVQLSQHAKKSTAHLGIKRPSAGFGAGETWASSEKAGFGAGEAISRKRAHNRVIVCKS